MVDRAAGRGSRNGIDGAVLATSVGNLGTILEATVPEANWCRADVGSAASGTSPIQSWTQGAEERLSRCRASGKTARGPGVDPEFCARPGTTPLAHRNTPQAPTDAKPRTVA